MADGRHRLHRAEEVQAHTYELDAVAVGMMTLTCAHAYRCSAWPLVGSLLILAVVLEQFSVRMGTHCHAPGALNITECSSVNSVLFYVPWMYSAITCSRRLVDERSWALPCLCAALFLSFRAGYEVQGPAMGWWTWPRGDGLVQDGCRLWQPGALGADLRGLVAGTVVREELAVQVEGVPAVMVILLFGLGWGIAVAAQVAEWHGSLLPVCVVCLGPLLGAAWLPVLHIVEASFKASRVAASAGLALLAPVLAVLAGPPLRRDQPLDLLLLGAPSLHCAFFVHHAVLGRGASVLAGETKLFVAALSVCVILSCARASGVFREWEYRRNQMAGESASWIDRLQRCAQSSELEPATTSPSEFMLLAAIQLPSCIGVAWLFSCPTWTAVFPIFSHGTMFVVSHYVLQTNRLFDINGMATFLVMVAVSRSTGAGDSRRRVLLSLASGLWCVRLGLFLGHRIIRRGADWRYSKFMKVAAYNCYGWVSQGTWIFTQGICIWVCDASPLPAGGSPPLGVFDAVALVVWATGLVIEAVADLQKSRWNAVFTSGRQHTWLQNGLWRYSRHPNYFGEIVVWIGLAALSAGELPTAMDAAIAFVSPLWSFFFIVFTSIMLLEKRLDAKFLERPDYKAYKASTSVLMPWPSRRRRADASGDAKGAVRGPSGEGHRHNGVAAPRPVPAPSLDHGHRLQPSCSPAGIWALLRERGRGA